MDGYELTNEILAATGCATYHTSLVRTSFYKGADEHPGNPLYEVRFVSLPGKVGVWRLFDSRGKRIGRGSWGSRGEALSALLARLPL
jgi:hypothetical protein